MKKQIFLWIAFCVLAAPNAHTQSQLQYDWSFAIDLEARNELFAGNTASEQNPVPSRDGGFYIYLPKGSVNSITDIDPLSSHFVNPLTTNGVVVKYNAAGQLVSFQPFEYANNYSLVDSDGNLYTTVVVQDSANRGNIYTPHWLYSTAPNGHSLFIVKYSYTGVLLWANEIKLNFPSAAIYHQDFINFSYWALDDNDNLYLAAPMGIYDTINTGYQIELVDKISNVTTTIEVVGPYEFLVAKFTSNGAVAWASKFGDTQPYRGTAVDFCEGVFVKQIKTDHQGNWYLVGTLTGDVDFDTTTQGAHLISRQGIETYVAKFNSNGRCQWVNATINGFNTQGLAVAINTQGDVYLLARARYFSMPDFNPDTNVINTPVVPSSFVLPYYCLAKYNANGAFVDVKATIQAFGPFSFGTYPPVVVPTINRINLYCDATDNLYILGTAQGLENMNVLDTGMVNTAYTPWFAFWSKYSPQNQFVEGYNLGGVILKGLFVDAQENMVVFGIADSCDMDLDIDSTRITSPPCDSTSNFRYFVVRYKNLLSSSPVIANPNTATQLNVYPNPAYHSATLQYNSTSTMPYLVQIIDAQGRILQHSKYNANSVELDLQHLPVGFYTIRVLDGNQQYHQKLLIQR